MGIKSASILAVALAILTIFVELTSACSPRPRVGERYDENEFVFTATVSGYLSPVSAVKPFTRWEIRDESKRTYAGLLLKSEEQKQVAIAPAQYFEVFPIYIYGECEPIGASIARLMKSFPLGTKVSVIATRVNKLPDTSDEKNIRLESDVQSGGHIFRYQNK